MHPDISIIETDKLQTTGKASLTVLGEQVGTAWLRRVVRAHDDQPIGKNHPITGLPFTSKKDQKHSKAGQTNRG